jgi:hypothetical protein
MFTCHRKFRHWQLSWSHALGTQTLSAIRATAFLDFQLLSTPAKLRADSWKGTASHVAEKLSADEILKGQPLQPCRQAPEAIQAPQGTSGSRPLLGCGRSRRKRRAADAARNWDSGTRLSQRASRQAAFVARVLSASRGADTRPFAQNAKRRPRVRFIRGVTGWASRHPTLCREKHGPIPAP